MLALVTSIGILLLKNACSDYCASPQLSTLGAKCSASWQLTDTIVTFANLCLSDSGRLLKEADDPLNHTKHHEGTRIMSFITWCNFELFRDPWWIVCRSLDRGSFVFSRLMEYHQASMEGVASRSATPLSIYPGRLSQLLFFTDPKRPCSLFAGVFGIYDNHLDVKGISG